MLSFFIIDFYWIQPDKPSKKNPILVHCEFETNRTCVPPIENRPVSVLPNISSASVRPAGLILYFLFIV